MSLGLRGLGLGLVLKQYEPYVSIWKVRISSFQVADYHTPALSYWHVCAFTTLVRWLLLFSVVCAPSGLYQGSHACFNATYC